MRLHLLAFVLFAAGCQHAHPDLSNLTHDRGVLHFQDWDRTYEVYLPKGKNLPPMPLVLTFHGANGTGAEQAKLGHLDELALTEGFVLVAPDGVDHSWNDGRPGTNAADLKVDDVGFIRALIDDLVKRYPIDQSRIYAIGMSNGALFTHRLGCDLSDRLAAVAMVAGAMPLMMSDRCSPRKPLPVIAFNGTDDPLVPYQGGFVAHGARAEVLSARATRERWGRLDGCTTKKAEKVGDDSNTGITIKRDLIGGCRNDVEVVTYTMDGGGHTWPGGVQYLPVRVIGKTAHALDASRVAWDFFRRYQRK